VVEATLLGADDLQLIENPFEELLFLMLLTDDGRIVHALLNPKFAHEREYIVIVDKYIKEQHIKLLARGVDIEGYKTKPAETKRINEKTISISLTEGKRHQIRRMLAALGYTVVDLKRVRIMNLRLGILKQGEHRMLTETEKGRFLDKLGVNVKTTKTE